MAGTNAPFGLGPHQLRQGEADARQSADMEKIASGSAAAEACPVLDAKLKHRDRLPGVVGVVGVAGEPESSESSASRREFHPAANIPRQSVYRTSLARPVQPRDRPLSLGSVVWDSLLNRGSRGA